MTNRRVSLVMISLVSALALSACETAKDADKKTRLDNFEPTGETRNCVSIARIDQADVIDDQAILFVVKGNDYYVNRLPYRCPQLGFEERFTYSLSGVTDLCNTDIITVLTSTGRGASCGLGMFETLKKKENENK